MTKNGYFSGKEKSGEGTRMEDLSECNFPILPPLFFFTSFNFGII